MRKAEDAGKGNGGTDSEDGGQQKTSDEDIKSAILSVMKKRGFVKSQEELTSIVADEINESVQPQRIRVLALELPQIGVRVLTKKSNREKPSNCPSCGKPLKALYAKNFLDRKVVVGLECNRCLYRGTLKSFAPFRYEFSLKQKSF
jgi:C4-type Zn-finger protein